MYENPGGHGPPCPPLPTPMAEMLNLQFILLYFKLFTVYWGRRLVKNVIWGEEVG